MSTDIHELFLSLVRLGIGHIDKSGFKFQHSGFKSVDWVALKALADAQGLTAIVLDGLNAVHDSGLMVDFPLQAVELNLHGSSLPVQMKLEWIGEVLQNYEQRYKAYENAIGSLARWYNQHGFKMMVLKGYACSLDWPKPEHRPCGDIDVWLFGQQREADAALTASFKFQDSGFKIDSSHHHHTVFEWEGFTVENHYDFVNVHAHRSSKELEVVFKELGQDDSHFVEVNGEKVYLPTANLHALFLVKHMVSHFAAAEITLRQVLDWAFFVKAHTKEIDWDWLVDLLEKYHMKDFYNCINAICVGDFGFDVRIFPSVQFDSALKDKVLADILEPAFSAAEPRGFVKRMIYKYKRWQGNAWKQEMCYPESRRETFWRGLWSHIRKP